MSRRARVGLAPSLFPFLAVLVCTLGTLILLLALVAQNATTSAQRQAAAKQAAEKLASEATDAEPKLTRETVDRMIQEGEFRVTQLVSFRDAQTADLEQRRDQITHVEDHMRRVREQLTRLSSEVELAMSDAAPKKTDERQIDQLKSKLESERVLLDELRLSAQSKKPRVVIVPHKGPNGTDRRPVYLECTSRGITIWPESSRIEIEQLLATESTANPLDAALRTVRLHAMQHYGDTIPPYPLLVVRPDGVETYIAARQAMLDWDDQFGYELVPAEVDLAFAKPDAQLKQKVDVAIREAVSNQRTRISIAGSTSGRGGGGVGSSGSGSSGRVKTLSAANLDREGRSGGFSDRDRSSMRGGYSSSTNYGSSPNYGSANSSGLSAAQRLDDHLQNAAEEMAAAGQNSGFAMPDSLGTSGVDGPQGTEPTALAASPGETAAQQGSETSGNGSQPSANGSTSKSANGFEMPAAKSLAGPSNAKSTDANGSQQGSANSQSSQSNSNDKAAGQFATGATSGGSDGGTQMQGGGSPTPQSSSATGGQASARGSADQAQNAQSVSVSNSPPPQSTRKMLQRKGNDWALPENVAGINGTAVVRTIRVVCYSDRFVLLPPASGGATEMFGFSDGEINRASLELAAAVRDRIGSWGPSLPGGRWQPRLDVEVAPDGVQRYQQFQALMNGSGVEVNGRPSQ